MSIARSRNILAVMARCCPTMSAAVVALFLVISAPGAQAAYEFNETGPLSQFKSRPDIYAPVLNVTTNDEGSVTPGYIFIGPYQTLQPGPYIYDYQGNLVWSGFQAVTGANTHTFHACPYKGADHLCLFTGVQYAGYSRGVGLILDDTLAPVASVQTQGGLSPMDQHEFTVVGNGESALLTSYQVRHADLSANGITGGMGWIMDSWFQEVELGTNKLLFQWSSLDHVDPSYSYVPPNSAESSGTGFDPMEPWDYFHINSIDKDSNGDYLVSARHTATIYKVSGKDGSIIWQLGGMASDFTIEKPANFKYQHDARWRFQNSTTTVISIFDNAADGYQTQSANFSSGKIIKIDQTSKTATLLQEFYTPEKFISSSQGSVQVFNNDWEHGNVFIGWGENAYLSEHTSDGTMVWEAFFATTGSMNYRAYKANFTTNPTDAPAVYVYAQSMSSPSVWWMSWNGATAVKSWKIYVSPNGATGSFVVLDAVPNAGFETMYTGDSYHQWSIVEALDGNGNGIRNTSTAVETFVPGSMLAASGGCDEYGCAVAQGYVGRARVAPQSHIAGSPTVVAVSGPTGSSGGPSRRVDWKGVMLAEFVGSAAPLALLLSILCFID